MVEEINHDRRCFLATAVMTIASAELAMICSSAAQSSNAKPTSVPAIKPGTNKSFGPLKQIDAGVLNIGYAEMGPSGGPPVILLREAIRVRGDSCPRRFVSEAIRVRGDSCQTCLSLLTLLQRPANIGRMTSKKSGYLGSEIALLQHSFADESIPGLYDVC